MTVSFRVRPDRDVNSSTSTLSVFHLAFLSRAAYSCSTTYTDRFFRASKGDTSDGILKLSGGEKREKNHKRGAIKVTEISLNYWFGAVLREHQVLL